MSNEFETINKDMLIPVCAGCGRCVYQLNDTWFCYIQHDHTISFSNGQKNPTHGKIFMRNGEWRGAMKAFIVNYEEEGSKNLLDRKVIQHLQVIRVSKSGKSVIVKAIFKE